MFHSITLFIGISAVFWFTCSNVEGQLLRADVMNLGVYNPETKHYEKKAELIGRDDHDKKPHQQHLLGGGDHDRVLHEQTILGGDDHDKKPHQQHLIGGDGHDHVIHGQPILGGDDHDKKPHHRQHLLGGDGHDHVVHEQPILGGGDHDKKPHHRQHLLGGDNHDQVLHGKPIFGGDDHDKRPHHSQHFLGEDGHDQVLRGRPNLGGDDHDKKPHHHQHLLGGDGHDQVLRGRPNLGGDDHDKKPHHHQHLLGGDGHDQVLRGRPILGVDDHDWKPHHQHLLGREGSLPEQRPHGSWLGGGDHDLKPHRVHLLGGDDHDLHQHGQHLLGRDGHQKKNNTMKLNALSSFREFMIEHNKQYEGQSEFRTRFSIFRHNLQRIKQFQRAERGTATYGITKFADLSETEFRQLLGFRPAMRRPSPNRHLVTVVPDGDLPETFDWRQHGVVTPIKNQGMCGSCWAFSTTGNVEGQWALKNSKLISLSEQELVDCDSEDHGCEGGLPENAYDAIEKLGGLETEEEYPYNGSDGTCHMEATKTRVQVNGSVELPTNEDQLAHWLYKNGPISIGINANPLQFYTGGVSHPLRFLCNPDNLDHGMLIVGFGTHTTKYLHRVQPYWLIKNSWGTDWGEQGYYRVYRGDGTCGLNLMATSSIVPTLAVSPVA